MILCLWDSQSPASRSLWRWVPRCMRNWGHLEVCQPYTSHCGGPLCLVFGLNCKAMGTVLLQHEGMPARLLYSLWRSPTHQQHCLVVTQRLASIYSKKPRHRNPFRLFRSRLVKLQGKLSVQSASAHQCRGVPRTV